MFLPLESGLAARGVGQLQAVKVGGASLAGPLVRGHTEYTQYFIQLWPGGSALTDRGPWRLPTGLP